MRAIALAPEIGSRRWISARAARVDGRLVDVTSTMSGRIDRILVAEGEPVEKGARLVELDHGVSGSTPDRVAILAPTRERGLHRACRKNPALNRAESGVVPDSRTATLRHSWIRLQPRKR